MNAEALLACLATPACVVTQVSAGMIIGMLIFLVASGVTLIFGVLKVVNFTHGSFYMLATGCGFLVVLRAASTNDQAKTWDCRVDAVIL